MTDGFVDRQTGTRQRRSVATRERILEATFKALYEVGYARTTTSEVCRRADVSRGTLLHHFATTAELVTAAAEYIFARRLTEFQQHFAATGGDDRAGDAVELLWQILSGETYYAWLELVVAGRTDARLREHVREVAQRFGADVQRVYVALFPDADMERLEHRLAPSFAFAALNGLAIDRIYADDAHVREVVDGLKTLARIVEGSDD